MEILNKLSIKIPSDPFLPHENPVSSQFGQNVGLCLVNILVMAARWYQVTACEECGARTKISNHSVARLGWIQYTTHSPRNHFMFHCSSNVLRQGRKHTAWWLVCRGGAVSGIGTVTNTSINKWRGAGWCKAQHKPQNVFPMFRSKCHEHDDNLDCCCC